MSQIIKSSSGGGGGGGIQTINGDTGSITGSTVTVFAGRATKASGATVGFDNSGTVSTLSLVDANLNTFIGPFCGVIGTPGLANVGIGDLCLINIDANGNSNVAVGAAVLTNLVSGQSNIAIGNGTAQGYTSNESDNITIGTQNQEVAGESGVMRLGGDPIVATYIAGIAPVSASALTTPKFVYIDSTTNQLASSSSLVTSPPASSASTLALGTAYHNTLGYDVMVVVTLQENAGATYTFNLGVGPTSTPTQQTFYNATVGSLPCVTVPIYIPNNYYALLTQTAGAATIVGQIAMPI